MLRCASKCLYSSRRLILYRQVYLELNGVTRVVRVYDRHAENAANQGRSSGIKRTLRADKSNSGHGTPGTVQNMKSGMFATQSTFSLFGMHYLTS